VAVGPQKNEILDLAALALLKTEDAVDERCLPFLRDLESDDVRLTGRCPCVRLSAWRVAPRIEKSRLPRGVGDLLLDLGVCPLLLGREVAIGPASIEQSAGAAARCCST
jgi:hypothetical protein